MDNVKTKRHKVFSFKLAVQAGKATDYQGRMHEIIAYGESSLITSCEGEEYCFNEKGEHLSPFQTTRLLEPFVVEVWLLDFLAFNLETMTVVSMHDDVSEAAGTAFENNLDCLRTTNPINKPILKALGLDGYPKIESAPGQ